MSQRILLITPVFYGLENKIKNQLENSGHEVVWIENKELKGDYHGTNSKFKFLRRLYFLIFSPRYNYIKKQLDIIENQRFDILFAINAHILCPALHKILKINNPDIYSVLYLWDSFAMYNWKNELKYFKRVITFDRKDSEDLSLEYKPNFFLPADSQTILVEKYDLLFIGKFSSFRYFILKDLEKKFNELGLKFMIGLYPAYKKLFHNKLLYVLLKKLRIENEWIINYLLNFEAVEGLIVNCNLLEKSLSFEEYQALSSSSRIILDLPFEKQWGFTHRMIDALGHGKKVITTNSNIKIESFYNPDQIYIIDAENPVVDYNWIRDNKEFHTDIYFKDLELSEWLNYVINVRVA